MKAKVFVLSHCNALADPQSPSVLWDDNLVLKIAKILGNTSLKTKRSVPFAFISKFQAPDIQDPLKLW